jgi:hypothetical protein
MCCLSSFGQQQWFWRSAVPNAAMAAKVHKHWRLDDPSSHVGQAMTGHESRVHVISLFIEMPLAFAEKGV